MNKIVSSRRKFLKTSTAGVVGSALSGVLTVDQCCHAQGSEVIRVGLVGCGGRGTGAASNNLTADKRARLVAMGDVFQDRLQSSLENLQKLEVANQVAINPDRCFVGFDAYKQVIANCDVVLLCTPPHFRPMHIEAAVAAGKHLFAEKPCAVDAPGVRRVLAASEAAKKKGLTFVAGLQIRHGLGMRAAHQRIRDGAIGEIVALQANDYRGGIWVKPREPGQTDMEYQLRNWYYYTWLSGDFNVEQHVHMLDLCSWMKGEYPVRAMGTGGRQVRTGPEYGHIYDHFYITYEYADGAKLFAVCRQQDGCRSDISAIVMGAKGTANLSSRAISMTPSGSATPNWKYDGPSNVEIVAEHEALFASATDGKALNNGEYVAKSSLLAIMGRMAAYTGQSITWEQAMNSKEDLSPPAYDWNVKLPEPPVAMPGKTKFV